jgi:hypothetical protein
MTRKDYEAIARALRNSRIGFPGSREAAAGETALGHAAKLLSDHCAADNPRFDRARFLKACGLSV